MRLEPRSLAIVLASGAVVAVAFVALRDAAEPDALARPPQRAKAVVETAEADVAPSGDAARAGARPLGAARTAGGGGGAPDAGGERTAERGEPDAEAAYWRSAGIEDFKREIYAMEIDSVDGIHKLEALVHLEVEDTRQLWDTGWSGVDDWKRHQNGFTLERGDDGTMMFVPGEETQRLFTFFEGISLYEYDEANDAFVNEVDYYGKPIFNIVKFLREDVLVMMTISGHKVDLNIYQKGADGPVPP